MSSCGRAVGITPGCPLGLKRDRGERLPDLVVKFPGDPEPLRFLGCKSCAGCLPPGGLKPVQHGVEGLRESRALRTAQICKG